MQQPKLRSIEGRSNWRLLICSANIPLASAGNLAATSFIPIATNAVITELWNSEDTLFIIEPTQVHNSLLS